MKVTVSVVLPLYNGEAHIKHTLLSIAQQSYTDFELIIVDDGSTDGSEIIVRELIRETSFTVLKNIKYLKKENGGVASARNYGVEHACGEWIAFIDQDDLWEPAKLKRQLDLLKAQNSLWSYSSFVRFYPDGREVLKCNGSSDRESTFRFLASGKLFIPPSTLLISKELCVNEGGFVSDYIPSDEWDFFLTLSKKYVPAYCPDVLVRFRSHPESTGKRQKRKIFIAQLKVLDKHWQSLNIAGLKKEANKRKANVLWHLGQECEAEKDYKGALEYYIGAISNNRLRGKLIVSYIRCFMSAMIFRKR